MTISFCRLCQFPECFGTVSWVTGTASGLQKKFAPAITKCYCLKDLRSGHTWSVVVVVVVVIVIVDVIVVVVVVVVVVGSCSCSNNRIS